jgi:four helix bundle protein
VDKRELQQRTRQFGLRILKLVDALPNTAAGRAISNQLVRSATSVGANYRAACRARSRVQFAAKLGTLLEEADESLYWLEMIRDAKLIPEAKISLLLKEADELTAIVAAGRKSLTKQLKYLKSNIFHLT